MNMRDKTVFDGIEAKLCHNSMSSISSVYTLTYAKHSDDKIKEKMNS